MVLYGGQSGEHEISIRSAASVLSQLDPARYSIVPVYIDPGGRWFPQTLQTLETPSRYSLPEGPQTGADLSGVLLHAPGELTARLVQPLLANPASIAVDVVLPVLHGTLGEDGTLQGLMEMAQLPYVGCGVLASALAMDKVFAKRMLAQAGLPVVPYRVIHSPAQLARMVDELRSELGLPLFVKPANAGSSLGVHRVVELGQLEEAVRDALQYDTKVLIEKAVVAREIELAVLEGDHGEIQVSIPGEVEPTHDFYSYQAKYIDELGARLLIPAPLSPTQTREAQELARAAFMAIGGEGMARVDLFLDKTTTNFFVNELNTLPGFTSISMYPKLWEASGLSTSDLLDTLIRRAIERGGRRQRLKRTYSPA